VGFGAVGWVGRVCGGGIVVWWGGLPVYGAKKGLCVGVLVWILGRVGFGGKFTRGNCPIYENLSTFQNSQNFVNFHLSKIKGGTFKQSRPWLYSTRRLCNFYFIFIIRSNSLYPFPLGNKPAKNVISPFFWLV